GFFCVGIVPTGSEDPLALRRQATAIVRILVEGHLRLPLDELLAQARRQVETQGLSRAQPQAGGGSAGAPSDPVAFVADRLRHYGRSVRALRDDVMEAVLGSDGRRPFDVVDLLARMEAVQALTSRPEFEPLMIGFKRAHRLVEKEGWTEEAVDPTWFQHQAEQDLMRLLDESRRVVPTAIQRGAYGDALEALVRMKPAIDAFFVGVMVNAKDPALRANRLSLLRAVDRLFLTFADFSQIQVQGG
ncbi:MAG: glycine--tRNA ligase subunit beta, partial [Nitrospirales bacterium]